MFKAIEAQLMSCAKASNFNSLEKVKDNFVLLAEEFPQGEVLTPTLKLKRKQARDYYKEKIDKIYADADRKLAQ